MSPHSVHLMPKSKLQELCSRNSWGLPEYSTIKVGPDHNACFSAIVTVKGVRYRTLDQSPTVKQAENKAAEIAFNHLSNASAPTFIPRKHSFKAPITDNYHIDPLSGGGTLQPTMTNDTLATLVNETPVVEKFIDVQYSYKSRLQTYAQRRKLERPVYLCEQEGPIDANRFKAKVTVDGKSYESPELFNTKVDAEHAAAKVACESLAIETVRKDASGLHKSLIQELGQRTRHFPQYKTTVYGPPHNPIYVSTVEIGGQSFRGQATKKKIEAENSAAKVAYLSFQERYQSGQANQIWRSPHVRETNISVVYVPVHIPSAATKEVARLLKKFSSLAPGLKAVGENIPLSIHLDDDLKFEQFALGRELHISLGRTVYISTQLIDLVVSDLRQKLQFQRQMFWIDFGKLEVFFSDHHNRSFLSIEVVARGSDELIKLIEAVNEVYKLHKLPKFFTDPRPHVSIAWALGDISDLLKEGIAEEMKKYTSDRGDLQKPIFTSKYTGINCKIGNQTYPIS